MLVLFDPDAVIELATAVKSKEDKKAIFNAIDKLRQLGEHLAPPHMKPLRGASDLRELRPRQGRTNWRPIYARRGDVYIVLAVGRHDEFDALVARAERRLAQYGHLTS
jgi:hypothetical protein